MWSGDTKDARIHGLEALVKNLELQVFEAKGEPMLEQEELLDYQENRDIQVPGTPRRAERKGERFLRDCEKISSCHELHNRKWKP